MHYIIAQKTFLLCKILLRPEKIKERNLKTLPDLVEIETLTHNPLCAFVHQSRQVPLG